MWLVFITQTLCLSKFPIKIYLPNRHRLQFFATLYHWYHPGPIHHLLSRLLQQLPLCLPLSYSLQSSQCDLFTTHIVSYSAKTFTTIPTSAPTKSQLLKWPTRPLNIACLCLDALYPKVNKHSVIIIFRSCSCPVVRGLP